MRGPAVAIRYLLSAATGRPEHHAGHNPAGGLAIIALLVLALVVTGAGWATYSFGADGAEDLHEVAANAMLALVGIHVIAVLASSWLHRQNLVGAMITGRKLGQADESIVGPKRGIALMMLVVVLGFWWLEWRNAPSGLDLAPPAVTATAVSRDHDRDDD